jgi:hypothetical protein
VTRAPGKRAAPERRKRLRLRSRQSRARLHPAGPLSLLPDKMLAGWAGWPVGWASAPVCSLRGVCAGRAFDQMAICLLEARHAHGWMFLLALRGRSSVSVEGVSGEQQYDGSSTLES